jgi:hypothetical protein
MHNDINLVNSEIKLLYDIRELLIEQNELIKSLITKENQNESNNQPKLDGLKRADLMALIKELPNKPQGWTKLPNEELKALLKDGDINGSRKNVKKC